MTDYRSEFLSFSRKTQLANKYVHDRRRNDPKASILWITARSEDEIKSGFQAIADKLMLEFRVEALLYEQSKQLQSEEPGQQAVDTSLDLLNRWLCSPLHEGWLLVLDNYDDARQLFLDIQGPNTGDLRNKITAHPEAEVLADILKELQYFPLAIDQAASFIRENSPMTFREYLGYLRPRTVDRERLLRFKQANPLYPESVMTT